MSSLHTYNESKFNINSVGYLDMSESDIFTISSSREYFFGNDNRDFIEVSVENSNGEINYYGSITCSSEPTKTIYTYYDVDDNIFTDYYLKQNSVLIQDNFKNTLLPIDDIVEKAGISDSNFVLSIIPLSDWISIKNSLIIKEISNTRREIKLIPSFEKTSLFNDITLTLNKDKIFLNGNLESKFHSGIVYTIKSDIDISYIKFSKFEGGSLNNEPDYVTNIIYNKSTNTIVLDTTEDFPSTLFVYHKNIKGSDSKIIFDETEDKTFIYKLNTEFASLKEDCFINKDILEDVEYYLSTFNENFIFDETKYNKKDQISSLKSFLSIKDDEGVTDIIKRIYYGDVRDKQNIMYGIKEFVLNQIRFNHEFLNTFDNWTSTIDKIIITSCDKWLRLFNKNVNSDLYSISIKYLIGIYSSFLKKYVSVIQSYYENKYKSPLKNALNLGVGKLYPILNFKIDGDQLVVKLKDPIDTEFQIGKKCDVTNISIVPFKQYISYENRDVESNIKIAGPNFSISSQGFEKINSNTGYFTTADLSLERTVNNNVNVNKTLINNNVDYSDFSNFVVFSSIHSRLKIFERKLITITTIESENVSLAAYDVSGSTVNDRLSVYQKISSNESIVDDIIKNFDGYEAYLYKSNKFFYNIDESLFVESSGSTTISSYVSSLENDAIEYDKNNRDSLINNTPEYIFENPENDEYLKFLNMIGHHFDNIYVYISGIGLYKSNNIDSQSGISDKLLNHMLDSFGFKVPPGLSGLVDGSSIEDAYISSTDSASSKLTTSISEKTRILWKRILDNLPILYKTKGTQECIRHILSIYGIPNNLIVIKEFGGGYTQNEISSSYKVDEKMYFLEFIGKFGEYVEFVDLPSYKSVDFKIKIDDQAYITSSRTIIPLHSKFANSGEQIYSFGLVKLNKKYGSFYFIINDDSGSFVKITDPSPLFNGEVMSVMLRKNYVDSYFEESADNSNIPTQYDICVFRNEYDDTETPKKYSFFLTGSLNSLFDQSGFVSFGNNTYSRSLATANILSEYGNSLTEQISAFFTSQSVDYYIITEPTLNAFINNNISSYTVDKFVGCMDKFTFQSTPLSDHDFYLKTKNFNCYYQGEPSSSYEDIIFRYDTGIPIDIMYSSSVGSGYRMENANKSLSDYYAVLFNFTGSNVSHLFNTSSCVSQSISYFPHQTRELNITNEYFTGETGPSRFENDKIEKTVVSLLDSGLSPITSQASKQRHNFYKDSNKLGIFLSPIHERNMDILNFFGDHEIVSSISNPYEKNGRKYEGLNKLRQNYYANNSTSKILFNELFKIYKIFVDVSIFPTIRNILPGRNKVYSGILIEPTILERTVVENKPVEIVNINTLTCSLNLSPLINGDDDIGNLITQSSSEVDVFNSDGRFYSYGGNGFCEFFSIKDSLDDYSRNICVYSSSNMVEYNGNLYKAYVTPKKMTMTYKNNGESLNVEKDFKKITLILSSSITDGSILSSSINSQVSSGLFVPMTDISDIPHLSRKNLPLRKQTYGSGSMSNTLIFRSTSRQTEDTTIEGGDNLGKSPIITTTTSKTIGIRNNTVSV